MYSQVMVNSRELSFHHEIHFRNSLVEYLTQWVSGELCTGEYCTHEDNLRRYVLYGCGFVLIRCGLVLVNWIYVL